MSGTFKLLCLVPDARVAQMSAVRTLRHAQSRRCRVGESATNPDLKIETVRYGAQSDANQQIHTIVRTGPGHTHRSHTVHTRLRNSRTANRTASWRLCTSASVGLGGRHFLLSRQRVVPFSDRSLTRACPGATARAVWPCRVKSRPELAAFGQLSGLPFYLNIP